MLPDKSPENWTRKREIMKINHTYMIPYVRSSKMKRGEYFLGKATLLCFYGAYGVKENIKMFGSEV